MEHAGIRYDRPPPLPPREAGGGGSALVALLLAGVLLLVPLPEMGRVAGALQNLAHVPLGAALAWAIRPSLARALGARGLVGALLALLLTSAALLLFEVVQPLTGRTFAWTDWETGSLGAAGAMAFGRGQALGRGAGLLGGALGLALLAVGAHDPALELVDAWRQARDLPLLATFESSLEIRRFGFQGARGEIVANGAAGDTHALRVDFAPGPWPSVTLASPPPDWRGWSALAFDVHVDGGGTLALTVKVVDRDHDGTYEDRFQKTITLTAGDHHVEIPVGEIAEGPVHRHLDLARIDAVQWFVEGLAQPRTILLDSIRLVHAPK